MRLDWPSTPRLRARACDGSLGKSRAGVTGKAGLARRLESVSSRSSLAVRISRTVPQSVQVAVEFAQIDWDILLLRYGSGISVLFRKSQWSWSSVLRYGPGVLQDGMVHTPFFYNGGYRGYGSLSEMRSDLFKSLFQMFLSFKIFVFVFMSFLSFLSVLF